MSSAQPGPEPPRRLDDLDYSHLRLHGPVFEGTRITDGWLRNADISADIEGLRINGVDIAPLVRAELDRQFPQRLLLRVGDPDGLAQGWEFIERTWADTVARARSLTPAQLDESVDGEWSFVETLRHLILATDLWYFRMIDGGKRAYHPWGLPPAPSSEAADWGLDESASPGLDEVLEVRRERMDAVKAAIHSLGQHELERVCEPPATPGHPNYPCTVLHCLHVILNEEWEHARYANRDLDVLLATPEA